MPRTGHHWYEKAASRRQLRIAAKDPQQLIPNETATKGYQGGPLLLVLPGVQQGPFSSGLSLLLFHLRFLVQLFPQPCVERGADAATSSCRVRPREEVVLVVDGARSR